MISKGHGHVGQRGGSVMLSFALDVPLAPYQSKKVSPDGWHGMRRLYLPYSSCNFPAWNDDSTTF